MAFAGPTSGSRCPPGLPSRLRHALAPRSPPGLPSRLRVARCARFGSPGGGPLLEPQNHIRARAVWVPGGRFSRSRASENIKNMPINIIVLFHVNHRSSEGNKTYLDTWARVCYNGSMERMDYYIVGDECSLKVRAAELNRRLLSLPCVQAQMIHRHLIKRCVSLGLNLNVIPMTISRDKLQTDGQTLVRKKGHGQMNI